MLRLFVGALFVRTGVQFKLMNAGVYSDAFLVPFTTCMPLYANFSRKWGERHNNARNVSLIYPFFNVNIQQYRKFHSPPSVKYESPPGLIQRTNRYMVEP